MTGHTRNIHNGRHSLKREVTFLLHNHAVLSRLLKSLLFLMCQSNMTSRLPPMKDLVLHINRLLHEGYGRET